MALQLDIHPIVAENFPTWVQFTDYLPPVNGVPQNTQFSLLNGDRHL
jgi:hypothetical protein